ncbi:hypothetical protein [Tenacibaculum sp.]|uniref:hypothetical protein n=1 Tax=Tenacibaculum sp. TaxID=1906242 RepID=UPI003D12B056
MQTVNIMEMSGEDYRALMEEKFKNVHTKIDRNYTEQKEHRAEDKKDILAKIEEVLVVVSGIKTDQTKTNESVESLKAETSGWRSLQKFVQKQPKTFFIIILATWYLLSQPTVKSFLFGWLPNKPKTEIPKTSHP